MEPMYYIGLDVHKRKINYCVKDSSGRIHSEGWIPATRFDLDHWMKSLPQPWSAAMEATMFTGWIYDHLIPQAAALKVAHPLMLRAIVLAKKKNDRVDARKICDCLHCDFLPECFDVRVGRQQLGEITGLVQTLFVVAHPGFHQQCADFNFHLHYLSHQQVAVTQRAPPLANRGWRHVRPAVHPAMEGCVCCCGSVARWWCA